MFRLQNNILQTPIIELQNPVTGGNIDLVGTANVGSQEYYASIQDYIATKEAKGAVVHYESAYHDQLATTLPEIQRPIEWKSTQSFADLCIKAYGLVDQLEAIQYKANWERHDAVVEEAIEVGVFPDPMRIGLIDKIVGYLPKRLLRPALNFGFDLATNPEGVQKNSTEYSLYREQIAVQAAIAATNKEAPHDNSLVMLWTSDHLPNFRHAFTTRYGYEQVDERWLNAFSLSKP